MTSDAHTGLVDAVGATLPGAAWRRCRTHYAANVMGVTPKSSWGWVKALLHSVYDQPDAASVHAQFDRILDALHGKLPAVAEHLEAARAACSRSPSSPARCGVRSGRTTPTLSPAVLGVSFMSGTGVGERAGSVLDVVISGLSMKEIGRRFEVRTEGGPTGVEG